MRHRMNGKMENTKFFIQKIEQTFNVKIDGELGHGMFGCVYHGIDQNRKEIAIKTFEREAWNEVEALQACKNAPYVIQMIDCQKIDNNTYALLQESFTSVSISVFVESLTLPILKNYLRMLLQGLAGIHEKGFLHNDIKEDNILVSPSFDDIRIIDFGCALKIRDSMPTNSGCRLSRPPEKLLGYTKFDEKADVWGVGKLALNFAAKDIRYYPWDANKAVLQGVRMAETFGKDNMIKLAEELNITVKPDIIDKMSNEITNPFDNIIQHIVPEFRDDNLIDFIKKALTLDPRKRISTVDLLKHPFLQ